MYEIIDEPLLNCILSEDVNNDHWIDILVTEANDTIIYDYRKLPSFRSRLDIISITIDTFYLVQLSTSRIYRSIVKVPFKMYVRSIAVLYFRKLI